MADDTFGPGVMGEELSRETASNYQRYFDAMHAMQAGVAMMQNYNAKETTPKDLRVGVNLSLINSSALGALLIRKGLITEEEYSEVLAEFAENDVKDYTDKIERTMGAKPGTIHLV